MLETKEKKNIKTSDPKVDTLKKNKEIEDKQSSNNESINIIIAKFIKKMIKRCTINVK